MVRQAKKEEIKDLVRIYEAARSFMHTHGNPTQWAGKYPDEETLLRDIEKGQLYAIENAHGKLCGCFALIGGIDPTYTEIYEGAWRSDKPYGTIHRIASDGTERGIFEKCFEFSRTKYNHLRIDTHNDNIPMRRAVEKLGFEYCGIIHLADGSPRVAYEWLEK